MNKNGKIKEKENNAKTVFESIKHINEFGKEFWISKSKIFLVLNLLFGKKYKQILTYINLWVNILLSERSTSQKIVQEVL